MRESVCFVLHHSCLFRLTMQRQTYFLLYSNQIVRKFISIVKETFAIFLRREKRINQIPKSKSQSTEQIKLKILARDDNRSITCQSRYLSKGSLQSVLIDRQERFSSCKIWNNEKNYDLSTPTLKKVWGKLTHEN